MSDVHLYIKCDENQHTSCVNCSRDRNTPIKSVHCINNYIDNFKECSNRPEKCGLKSPSSYLPRSKISQRYEKSKSTRTRPTFFYLF